MHEDFGPVTPRGLAQHSRGLVAVLDEFAYNTDDGAHQDVFTRGNIDEHRAWSLEVMRLSSRGGALACFGVRKPRLPVVTAAP